MFLYLLVNTVGRSQDPSLADESPPAGDPLTQQALLDDGGHPGVAPELGVLPAHYSVTPGIDLSTL